MQTRLPELNKQAVALKRLVAPMRAKQVTIRHSCAFFLNCRSEKPRSAVRLLRTELTIAGKIKWQSKRRITGFFQTFNISSQTCSNGGLRTANFNGWWFGRRGFVLTVERNIHQGPGVPQRRQLTLDSPPQQVLRVVVPCAKY